MPINEMIALAKKRPQLVIKRGIRGFGFTLRAIKVYYDDSDLYTIQHFVIGVDETGPAYESGLRIDDVITHVNDEVVCGRMHHEIVKSILSSTGHVLHLRTVNSKDTKIKSNGRKRSPSKIKLRRPPLLNNQAVDHKGSLKNSKPTSLSGSVKSGDSLASGSSAFMKGNIL